GSQPCFGAQGLLLLFYWYYGFALDLQCTLRVSSGRNNKVPTHQKPPSLLFRGCMLLILAPGSPDWLEHEPTMLSLMDPANSENDLGKYATVRPIFQRSYTRLMRAMQEPDTQSLAPAEAHSSEAIDQGDPDQLAHLRELAMQDDDEGGLSSSPARKDPPSLGRLLPRWHRSLTREQFVRCQKQWISMAKERRRLYAQICKPDAQELLRDELVNDPMWA
ncbi:MAG: hypothetical protein SGPRY_014037, partial [Prymnesium sp.]